MADLISRETASIIQFNLKDPRLGLITITGAEVSPDLKVARIYYTVLGDEEKRDETAKALKNAKGYIRHELGGRLKLKSTPEVRFTYDNSLDHSLRIDELLSGRADGKDPSD